MDHQWFEVRFQYGVAKNVFARNASDAIERAARSLPVQVNAVAVLPLGGLA